MGEGGIRIADLRRSRSRGLWRLRVLAALLLFAPLPACVTETRPAEPASTRRPVTPDAHADPVDLQQVSSAPDARTLNTAISVALKPLGRVPYDGQVLPLVSPDGRFVATQTGEPPSWPALLAAPDATLPAGTRIEIYDISAQPIRQVTPVEPLPPGLVLGRAAGPGGFLVESPRPDGARWLARVDWRTGTLTWLVRDPVVASHGVITPGGRVLFLHRTSPGGWQLAATTPSGWSPIDTGAVRPLALLAARPGRLDLLAEGDAAGGLDVVAMRLASGGGVGPVLARRRVAPAAATDPTTIYQIATSVRTGPAGALALYLPAARTLGLFEPEASDLRLLARDAIAASPTVFTSEPGWFCTTPAGLVYVATETLNDAAPSPHARVLADPHVPWATTDPTRPIVLLGPDPRNQRRITVALLGPAD